MANLCNAAVAVNTAVAAVRNKKLLKSNKKHGKLDSVLLNVPLPCAIILHVKKDSLFQ